ncbi:autotransporter-associated beta strand repeat-containing protein, partial [bacterium]|nr:autotransporter-associated beta strand repeat-containing protein [bacterium]
MSPTRLFRRLLLRPLATRTTPPIRRAPRPLGAGVERLEARDVPATLDLTGTTLTLTLDPGASAEMTGTATALTFNAGLGFTVTANAGAQGLGFTDGLQSSGAGDLTTVTQLNIVGGAGTETFNISTTGGTFPAFAVANSVEVTGLNATSFDTGGAAQVYDGAVVLLAGATLTGSVVTFGGAVDGAFGLSVTASGLTAFNGVVGGTTPLASLSTDAAGSTTIAGDVTTTGNQTFGDNTTLTGAATLASTGGDIAFNQAIDGGFALTVNAAGGTTFVGGVGGTTPLASLTVVTGTLAADAVSTSGGLSVTNTGTGSVTGVIAGTTVTKSGAGTLTLSGASTYTGATLVNAGVLSITGSVTSNVTVGAGGTLGGTGTITGNVDGTGTFAPGLSPGVMTINGNFTPTGTVQFEVNPPATAAGTNYDQYIVTGTVNLSGAALLFTGAAGAVADGLTVTLISNDLLDPTVPGANPADGATVTINGTDYVLAYNGGDGNDVVLVTPVDILVADTSVLEGSSGTATLTFTITLGVASSATVTVNYLTADGTATVADGDYVPTFGTLTFLPGETTKTVLVTVNGDTVNEADETVLLNFSTPVNAVLSATQAVGTITNDDPLPTVSIGDATLPEGAVGPTPFTFTVTLSAASGQTVTVNYLTADGTATVADGDYAAAAGTLTFLPGETTKTVTVLVAGDAANEADETFTVTLSSPTNATVATGTGTGTITNDDPV